VVELGGSPALIRSTAALVAGLVVVVVLLLGIELRGSIVGWTAAALLATVGSSPFIEGFTLAGELLATLPAALAVLAFAHYLRDRRATWLVAAGARRRLRSRAPVARALSRAARRLGRDSGDRRGRDAPALARGRHRPGTRHLAARSAPRHRRGCGEVRPRAFATRRPRPGALGGRQRLLPRRPAAGVALHVAATDRVRPRSARRGAQAAGGADAGARRPRAGALGRRSEREDGTDPGQPIPPRGRRRRGAHPRAGQGLTRPSASVPPARSAT